MTDNTFMKSRVDRGFTGCGGDSGVGGQCVDYIQFTFGIVDVVFDFYVRCQVVR